MGTARVGSRQMTLETRALLVLIAACLPVLAVQVLVEVVTRG